MRRLALISSFAVLLLAGCGTAPRSKTPFAQPNKLMGNEIEKRVADIQYQHREELLNNLLWLVQSGEQAIPALLDGLHHEHAKVRSNAAWCLGAMGDRRVIPHLQQLSRDSQEAVRLEATRSLVTLGDMKYMPQLIEALDSEKVQVRYLCHEALKLATGRDFGFDHLSDNVVDRRKSVLSWRGWWGKQSDDPWFAKQYADEHGLLMDSKPTSEFQGGQTGDPANPGARPMTETRQPDRGDTTEPERTDADRRRGGEDPEFDRAMREPPDSETDLGVDRRSSRRPDRSRDAKVEWPDTSTGDDDDTKTDSRDSTSPPIAGDGGLPVEAGEFLSTERMTAALEDMKKAMSSSDVDAVIAHFNQVREQIQVPSDDPRHQLYLDIEAIYLRARLSREMGGKGGANKGGEPSPAPIPVGKDASSDPSKR